MKNDVNDTAGGFVTALGIFIGRLRIAFRGLWKKPLITVSAIISIALGIGVSTAMFSIYDEFLMRRLPVPEPERLVNFYTSGSMPPGEQYASMAGSYNAIFSYQMFHDLEGAQKAFTGIAAHHQFDVNIAWRGVGDKQQGMLVSGGYFPTLGLKPAIGRLLSPDDDKILGEAHSVVLSHAYWQDRFGGDPGVVNQAITVNGQPMTIVGVAPQGFKGTTLGVTPRIFIPVTMRVEQRGMPQMPYKRTYHWLHIFGRLKPGVTPEQAAAATNVLYRNFLNEYDAPEIELSVGADSTIMNQFKEKQLLLKPGARGQSTIFDSNTVWLKFFMGGAFLLLIIACANVINLFVARGIARAGEMALRSSLGATRGQIAKQLLTESFVFVIIAGTAGILAAHWILRFILALFPAQYAGLFSFSINEKSMLLAALLTFVVCVSVGLFPALHGARNNTTILLKEQGEQTTGSKSAAKVRTALIIAQIAFSLPLLIISGIFAQSLYNIYHIDLGMKTDHVAVFGVSPSQNGYTTQQSLRFFERLEEELAAIPGIVSVTSSWNPMFSGSSIGMNINAEGSAELGDKSTRIDFVGANYLKTLGIPLISGRDFTNEDIHGAGQKSVIVNEAFAEKFGFDRNVLGKHVAVPSFNNLDYEIIGLAKNAKYASVEGNPEPFLFLPYSKYQFFKPGNLNFYVKTVLPEDGIIPQIRNLVSKIDPIIPIEGLTTMTQTIRDNVFFRRFMFIIAVSIAFFATLLTAVGLYGIFAYDAARRRREIGLRMALGATRARLCMKFLRRAALITLAGCVIGFALSFFAVKLISSMEYMFKDFNMVAFETTALLFLIMILIVLIPVRRAVMTEPLESLRDE